jgi:hypothetical protein
MRRRGWRLVALAAVVVMAGACASSHPRQAVLDNPAATTAPTSSTTAPASPPTAPPATVAGQLPTVPNCGGGAYKPTTLLIVCGDGPTGSTMATGVSWTSWNAESAAGTGSVHLVAHGQPVVAPGRLTLGMVTRGSMGPQFTRLTVTWTGMSPDGNPSHVYTLQIEP